MKREVEAEPLAERVDVEESEREQPEPHDREDLLRVDVYGHHALNRVSLKALFVFCLLNY